MPASIETSIKLVVCLLTLCTPLSPARRDRAMPVLASTTNFYPAGVSVLLGGWRREEVLRNELDYLEEAKHFEDAQRLHDPNKSRLVDVLAVVFKVENADIVYYRVHYRGAAVDVLRCVWAQGCIRMYPGSGQVLSSYVPIELTSSTNF